MIGKPFKVQLAFFHDNSSFGKYSYLYSPAFLSSLQRNQNGFCSVLVLSPHHAVFASGWAHQESTEMLAHPVAVNFGSILVCVIWRTKIGFTCSKLSSVCIAVIFAICIVFDAMQISHLEKKWFAFFHQSRYPASADSQIWFLLSY